VENVSLFVAFGAGVLSFFSPCVLPLIPAYLCLITGVSLDELQKGTAERITSSLRKILWPTLLFVLGFSFVFVSLGAAASYLGTLLSAHGKAIRIVGGAIIALLGLQVAGVFNIRKLQYEKRFHLSGRPAHMLGAFVVGVVFALGWTPCVGPVLAAILGLASTQQTLGRGVVLLSAYSLGLGIPFILSALAVNTFLAWFGRARKYLRFISIGTGILLVAVGIAIMIGWPRAIG